MPPLAFGSTSFQMAPACVCPPALAHTEKAPLGTDFLCPLEKQPGASPSSPQQNAMARPNVPFRSLVKASKDGVMILTFHTGNMAPSVQRGVNSHTGECAEKGTYPLG